MFSVHREIKMLLFSHSPKKNIWFHEWKKYSPEIIFFMSMTLNLFSRDPCEKPTKNKQKKNQEKIFSSVKLSEFYFGGEDTRKNKKSFRFTNKTKKITWFHILLKKE